MKIKVEVSGLEEMIRLIDKANSLTNELRMVVAELEIKLRNPEYASAPDITGSNQCAELQVSCKADEQ